MAHQIQGIITSFPYTGPLPHLQLLGPYHLIPLDDHTPREEIITPYESLSPKIRETLKTLSRQGKCAYIETNYFGGLGTQVSEIWENGERIAGPLLSYDGIENKMQNPAVSVVAEAINQALRDMGVQRAAEKDEFDMLGLGRFRSNHSVLKAIGD
ncbi:MAG TPA: hypothetical protein VJ953_15400 [Saprospiraceae bacterium]|nr:hypothetical protein [Saprospiraceae bacterium]